MGDGAVLSLGGVAVAAELSTFVVRFCVVFLYLRFAAV